MDRVREVALKTLSQDHIALRQQISQEETESQRLKGSRCLELQLQLLRHADAAREMRRRIAEYDDQIVELECELSELETCLYDLQKHHMGQIRGLAEELKQLKVQFRQRQPLSA